MLIRQIMGSLHMGLRMLKAAATRPLRAFWSRLRRSAGLGRQLSKLLPALSKGVGKIKLKPEAREDYIDAGPVFIAKGFFVAVALALVLCALFARFVGWPFLQSRFFTARLPEGDARAKTYTGRVELYADAEMETLLYRGRLEKGQKTGDGKEYYADGQLKYEGGFSQGRYAGEGTLYDGQNRRAYAGEFADGAYQGRGTLFQHGLPLYEGGLEQGAYQGEGRLYAADGKTLLYEGGFERGVYSGTGTLYDEAGGKRYEGGFAGGQYEGKGVLYEKGAPRFRGSFSAGLLTGDGAEFYPGGGVKYQGGFEQGVYHGTGALFRPDGSLAYKGGFLLGVYDGEGGEFFPNGAAAYTGAYVMGRRTGAGRLYEENGTLLYDGELLDGAYQGAGRLTLPSGDVLEGTFAQGAAEGPGTVYRNGKPYLEGSFAKGVPSGEGVLYNPQGRPVYQGAFESGVPCPAGLIGQATEDAEQAFAQARTEIRREDGYTLIVNRDAGVALLASLAGEGVPSEVYGVYVYGEELLSGCALESFSTAEAPLKEWDGPPDAGEPPVRADRSRTLEYEGRTLTLWGRAGPPKEDAPGADRARRDEAEMTPVALLQIRSKKELPRETPEAPPAEHDGREEIITDKNGQAFTRSKSGMRVPVKEG